MSVVWTDDEPETAPRRRRRPAAVNPREWFWTKFAKAGANECWPWLAGLNAYGYGVFNAGHRGKVMAHRYAYEVLVGPIPHGLDLDHLCRNRRCVNPAHLEPVTRRVNVLRGESVSARNAVATHCPRGHEFTTDNTGRYVRRTGRSIRYCRACNRLKASRVYHAKRAATRAARNS